MNLMSIGNDNMNTPETDNLARGNHVVPTEWAEQLERKRDEAREQCRKWLEEWHLTDKARREAKRERDEAREVLEFRRELYKVQENYLELARRERDNARLELKGCKAKNKRISAELLVKLQDIERERDEWAKLCGQYKQERDEARNEIKGLIPKK
jgi:hypothetical protein